MKREAAIWTAVILIAGVYLVFRTYQGRMAIEYERPADGLYVGATAWDAVVGDAQFSLSRTLGTWAAAIFTLCILSFLYKDNPLYKIAEAVVVGVSAGYWMVVGFWDVIVPNLLGKLAPASIHAWAMPGLSPVRDEDWYWYFVPLVLGVMLIWRMFPAGTWISRWPLAFIIGTTAGLRMVGFLKADFLSQIRNTIMPLAVPGEPGSPSVIAVTQTVGIDYTATIANILIVAGVLACLVYFFFSVEHTGAAGAASRVGIWVLMITFGAGFGYTVMGRIALLAIRMEFLFDDWLWLIDPRDIRPD